MVDRGRILVKLDELKGYLEELRAVRPVDLVHYRNSPTKRACERLLQLSIEATIDICKKLVIGNRLGIPVDEPDVFEKLKAAGLLSQEMLDVLKKMRGLRNVLVHEYADLDDESVFRTISGRLDDFERFQGEVLKYLNRNQA